MKNLESLVKQLKGNNIKVAVAESCTGGLLAAELTSIPGSSEFFEIGLITYSNEAKINLLGVKNSTIQQYGAVSENTAKEMALRIRDIANAHIGIAITGIAGPGGGSKDKPVGLVYIGIAMENNILIYKHLFAGNRKNIRKQSVSSAIANSLLLLMEER
ncbi:MAG: damage-inducible protein CinA [Desulfitibacter sp. BRH_c19]|nr:MAG: damage-inducible protein CinA [Desulfitibacter sp. BRH_c19]